MNREIETRVKNLAERVRMVSKIGFISPLSILFGAFSFQQTSPVVGKEEYIDEEEKAVETAAGTFVFDGHEGFAVSNFYDYIDGASPEFIHGFVRKPDGKKAAIMNNAKGSVQSGDVTFSVEGKDSKKNPQKGPTFEF